MYAPWKKLVGMETDRIRMESDPDITFLPDFKYECKTDVSYSDFYLDIYSIQYC
jgi:hypothetical protein